MKTQNDEILKALKSGVVLTQSYAINKFRCYRLAARIYDLRGLGHTIGSEAVKRKSKRSGRVIRYAAYWMEQT